jgi:hypothetical protein
MNNNKPSVTLNSFVLRQTAASRFSHFEGEMETVAKLAAEHFESASEGYKPGVLLVPVPAEGFRSGVVELTPDTKLRTTFEARREGETPFLQTVAIGASKLPAAVVEIVLYSHATLAADGENTGEADYEVVSINARPTPEPEPQTPVAMARNFLGLEGGTAATYTAEQFAESIRYWSTRAMAGE